jgi:stage V sporulation protein SpoVS
MALKYSTTLRNAQLDAITTAVGTSGILRIYSGSRPANVAAAITGTLLAELVCNASAFAAAASGGVLTANAIANDSSANASGTASHYRLFQSNGTTAVIDGDVSTSGADLNLDNTSINSGQVVSITSFTITAGNA